MVRDEWMHNVLAGRPALMQDQLNRTRQLMNAHVRDSLVTCFECLIVSISLPDPGDRHAAAALHAAASLIVTSNLKDFPLQTPRPCNLATQHPAGIPWRPQTHHQRSLKNRLNTANKCLGTLLALGLTQSVAIMRQWTGAV